MPGTQNHKFTRDNGISLGQQSSNWARELVNYYADENNRAEGFEYNEYFKEADEMPASVVDKANKIMSSMLAGEPSKNDYSNYTNYKMVTGDYLSELERQGEYAEFDTLLANGHSIPEGGLSKFATSQLKKR